MKDLPVNPLDFTFLKEQTPKGQPVAFKVSYSASLKSKKDWDVTVTCTPDGPLPQGQLRANFSGDVLVVSELGADRAVRGLVEKQFAFDAQVAEAREKFRDELRRDREERIDRFALLVKPGRLFTGVATARDGLKVPVSLEFATPPPGSRQLRALLRNDGGWPDAREFQGEWDVDASAERMAIELRSTAAESIPKAGPILSANLNWNLPLSTAADSGVADGQAAGCSYHFTAVAPADDAKVRAELQTSFQQCLDATAPNVLYQGSATSRKDYSSEPVVLRFLRQENNGGLVTAVLISARDPSWRRHLRGTLIVSKYRSGGRPIRFEAVAGRRLRRAPDNSVFSSLLNVAPSFFLEGGNLMGDDNNFHYTLAPMRQEEQDAHRARNNAYESPAYPTQPGAYALRDGEWIPLPVNGVKIVKGIKGVANQISAFFSSLTKEDDEDSAPKNVHSADLVFEGTEPLPAIKANPLVLAFVGPTRPFPADMLAKNPDLHNYPAFEVTRTSAREDGKRSAELFRIAPGVTGFADKRLAADLEYPVDGVILFTCVAPAEPGNYAISILNSPTQAFEFKVLGDGGTPAAK